MQKLVQISAQDVEELASMIEKLVPHYEDTINHGVSNDDDSYNIACNIKSETVYCGVYRWASKFFKEFEELAMNPDHNCFDDETND